MIARARTTSPLLGQFSARYSANPRRAIRIAIQSTTIVSGQAIMSAVPFRIFQYCCCLKFSRRQRFGSTVRGHHDGNGKPRRQNINGVSYQADQRRLHEVPGPQWFWRDWHRRIGVFEVRHMDFCDNFAANVGVSST